MHTRRLIPRAIIHDLPPELRAAIADRHRGAAFKHVETWLAFTVFFACMSIGLRLMMIDPTRIGRALGVGIVGFGLVAVFWIVISLQNRYVLAELRRELLCTTCYYDLRSCEPVFGVVCPECGTRVHLDTLNTLSRRLAQASHRSAPLRA